MSVFDICAFLSARKPIPWFDKKVTAWLYVSMEIDFNNFNISDFRILIKLWIFKFFENKSSIQFFLCLSSQVTSFRD